MNRRDIALEKGMPVALETERLVLGSMLAGDSEFGLIAALLSREDFAIEDHRAIWSTCEEVYRSGGRLDRVTIYTALKEYGRSIDLSYLCSLDEGMPALANIEQYCRKVKERSIRRRGALLASQLQDRFLASPDDASDVLSEAERLLKELGKEQVEGGTLTSANDIVASIDLNAYGRVPGDIVRTPYAKLNRQIVGMFPGELHVVGARPSAGKSVMAAESAIVAGRAGHVTALFSLEMKQVPIINRMACNIGNVSGTRLRHGNLYDIERHDLLRALSEISELPIYVDQKAQTFAAMAAEVRRLSAKSPVRLMIVDHLHLMRSVGRSENRNNELAAITRDLKLFAGEMNLTVLLLSQLNRGSETEKRPPEMRDLRECGSIEQDADVITFLHRREQMGEPDKRMPVPVDMLLAKQREGVAFVKIPMELYGWHYRFVEVDNAVSQEVA